MTKERLEKIKKRLPELISTDRDLVYADICPKAVYRDMQYLVQQAEQNIDLAVAYDNAKKEIQILEKGIDGLRRACQCHALDLFVARRQNKRYREAIKKGINATRYTNSEVAYILSEALEGETNGS